MPGPKPGARPRPMGGFNAGMGASSEHLDEAAMKAASQQKNLTQQQSSTQPASGKSGTNPLLSQAADAQSSVGEGKSTIQPDKPREVGDLGEELVKRPWADIKKGLASIFDLNALFGVNTADTPEEQSKKKSMHQRFQKLTAEQQQVAQKRYQEEMQHKKMEQEEEEQQRQEEEANKQQAVVAPTSTKKGPVGPASGQSKKQKTQSTLQQSRTGLSKSGKKY